VEGVCIQECWSTPSGVLRGTEYSEYLGSPLLVDSDDSIDASSSPGM
jgi:hypothetical protein